MSIIHFSAPRTVLVLRTTAHDLKSVEHFRVLWTLSLCQWKQTVWQVEEEIIRSKLVMLRLTCLQCSSRSGVLPQTSLSLDCWMKCLCQRCVLKLFKEPVTGLEPCVPTAVHLVHIQSGASGWVSSGKNPSQHTKTPLQRWHQCAEWGQLACSDHLNQCEYAGAASEFPTLLGYSSGLTAWSFGKCWKEGKELLPLQSDRENQDTVWGRRPSFLI